MRWGWRIACLAAVVLQAVSTVRLSIYDARFHAARMDYRADRSDEALQGFLSARAGRDADPNIWAWIGDSADAAYRDPTAAGWSRAEEERLASLEWSGYAGAVLRSPFDTSSWRGLAETALRNASRRDDESGVDLAVLERRSRGLLDPWRGLAMVAAKIAIDIKPSGFQELDVLARVYTSSGQVEAARDALIRSARMMPAPSFHAWGDGQRLVPPLYAAIMAAMQEGLPRAPGFEQSSLHRDIGRFALSQGDLPAALVEMDASVTTASDAEQRYLPLRGKAEVLEAMGRYDDAVLAWNAVMDTGYGAPVDRRERGLVLHRAHRDKEACRDLRESVRDDRANRDLRVLAAAVCEQAGDVETAERLLREGFVLPIDDPGLAKGLVDLYLRHAQRSTAEGLLRNWRRDFPQQAEIRRWADELTAETP